MANKDPERQRFVDQAAKSAHDVVTELHERAAKVEDELRQAAGAVAGGAQQEGSAVELTDIEGTVRSAVSYFQENPFAAAAMALGAGVVLTTMYWDKRSVTPGTTSRSMRKPGAAVRKAKASKAKARRR